jgi:hypothetical protein
MHHGTVSGMLAQSDDRDDMYQAVVADLASLIERVQASLTLIESAVAREASAAFQEMAANVIVLDDVTPRYLEACAALRACDASLGMALNFLCEPISDGRGIHDRHRSPHSATN